MPSFLMSLTGLEQPMPARRREWFEGSCPALTECATRERVMSSTRGDAMSGELA
jgi:hypothetical protein